MSRQDRKFLVGLLFFSIVISIIETAGISVIMPFIAVATDFNLIHTNGYYSYLYQFLEFDKEVSFVILFGMVLVFFYIFRSGINLLYFYLLNTFTQGMYHSLAHRLFQNYMGMTYGSFITKNSSLLTKSIVSEAVYLSMLISAIVFMLSEVFIALFIYAMMLYIDYKITFFLTLILAVSSLFILRTVSVRIKKAGVTREEAHKIFYEIVNRGFGNFKLIKLQSQDKNMVEDFGKASSTFARANINNDTLNQIPRLFLEAVGFGLIILIITYLVWRYEENISTVLSLVSMFVLALYRLMPSVNRIMTSYNQILFTHKSLDIIYSDLMQDRERLGNQQVDFQREITLDRLGFEYEKETIVLENINLKIQKGSKVAFVGESGSGKSTLVDILIGLYFPNRGEMRVDGTLITVENIKSWRSKVGYIPQSVYLFDGTVGENIAFGFEYNRDRVENCLKKAKIYDFLQQKKGQDTLVGEGGVMLSGGQKQRVAIARALYSEPEILVLDEATSALDDETEKEIMNEIYDISEDKTLIIIAHRLSTIDRCEEVYRLSHGQLVR